MSSAKGPEGKAGNSLNFMHLNTVWLSDIHLGYKGCQAEFLLDFLNSVTYDTLYLVGDIVDFWSMKKRFHWPEKHQQVLDHILEIARKGTKVIYIPGNHDGWNRSLAGQQLLHIEIHREYVHTTAQGKRLLLLHGDEFDSAVRCGRINKYLGNAAYELLLKLHRWGNYCRKLFNQRYWSLAYYVKNRITNAQTVIRAFEKAAVEECLKRQMDGIICGHIHQPELCVIDNVLYGNDGDWIENCTDLVEHRNGKVELIHWSDFHKTLKPAMSGSITSGDHYSEINSHKPSNTNSS